MQTSFTPSVNIIRDFDKPLMYLPTGNSQRLYNQIASEFKTGTRSFNVIGSYGTGKSAFLWAIEKQLSNKASYFGPINGHFDGVKRFEPVNVVGEYDSLIRSIARHIGITDKLVTDEKIIRKLTQYHDKASKKKAGLLIVIDELGKFLEYASANTAERELYFVQQLAEFCNDPARRMLLLTSLHQGFDSYARSLNEVQRLEWEKVKGRLRELPFNEPVEQLLFLAAEYLRSQSVQAQTGHDIRAITTFTENSHAFKFNTDLILETVKTLLPLEPLSAATLALALQKYGQNERSLFTFLSSNDHLGLRQFDRKANSLYNLSCVHDYLIGNHYSFISTRENHHYVQWAAIQRAIERVEGIVETEIQGALKLVKAIGLLNIFGNDGTRIDPDFLNTYGTTALGISEPMRIVKDLEEKKVLRYIQFKNRYVLFEGTDFDFGSAFATASSKVDQITDVVPYLQNHFTFSVIRCKAAHLKRGTPRFFEFQISGEPIILHPTGEIDGMINLVFPLHPSIDQVKLVSKGTKEAIIYCIFRNTSDIQRVLWEIERTKSVLASLVEDLVAKREVKAILEHQIKELNRLTVDEMFANTVTWVFRGRVVPIRSQQALNRYLSSVVERVYVHTPIFHNELINRHRLPAAVVTARKKLIDALIENWDKEDLGFPLNKFPPEKTIYLALLKHTGIHKKCSDGWSLGKPSNESFEQLWGTCESFLSCAKSARKPIADLFETLTSRPLKMKQGFAEVWVPIYLYIRREDYALFGEQGYIAHMTGEVVDLILKNPDRFWIKTFDIGGVRLDLLNRYRAFLSKQPSERISTTSFIDTIRPFLTFYRGLPEYARTTKRLAPSALALRDAIATAKDPEKTFFEEIPTALGYTLEVLRKDDQRLHEYVEKLQDSIREIRTAYDGLIDRIEKNLIEYLGYNALPFPRYREKLRARFLSLRQYLLLPHQRTFFQRLTSEIDDRKAWIGSIGQCTLGKSVELIKDDEEDALHSKLLSAIQELDNLCEITQAGIEPDLEEVIRFETTTLSEGTQKKLLRIPNSKTLAVDNLSAKLKSQLGSDNDVNVAALLKLLRELKHNE